MLNKTLFKKALIITEKPSVARDIVDALGGFTLSKVYQTNPQSSHRSPKPSAASQVWEHSNYVCTHALGHLLELYEPHDYHRNFKVWRIQDLPIVPPKFLIKPKGETKRLLNSIAALAERPDIDAILNACDAGREGELIFQEIIEYVGATKPCYRVWLQSLTKEAIKKAFSELKPSEQFSGLGSAAKARAESDWLYGINLTRAMTLNTSRASDTSVWTLGRVQTPTLAMLVEREIANLSHVPRHYHKLEAVFETSKGDHYTGQWHRGEANSEPTNSAKDKIFDPDQLSLLTQRLQLGSRAEVTDHTKTREQTAPYLFNLASLQRYMALHFDWTAKTTLQVAQQCYEKHKIITYPRTESDALPDDYTEGLQMIFARLADFPDYHEGASLLQEPSNWSNRERNFDRTRISDHFAIIPTGVFPKELPQEESQLFDAIIRRTLAAFLPPAIIETIERITTIDDDIFKTHPDEFTKVQGWQVALGTKRRKDGHKISPINAGEVVTLKQLQPEAHSTKPLPSIGEGELLSLMEFAGRKVDDEDLAKSLTACGGLGTAATRADIIESLKLRGYVHNNLQPTPKGIHLIRYLGLCKAASLTKPELTGELELMLSEVEAGRRTKDSFLMEITQNLKSSLRAINGFDIQKSFLKAPDLGSCPRCKKLTANVLVPAVRERMWSYSCASNSFDHGQSGCGFSFPKDFYGRYLEPMTVRRLLADDASDGVELGGFPQATRNSPPTRRLLCNEQGLSFVDGNRDLELLAQDNRPTKKAVAWGICPVHKADPCMIIETKKAFVCETRLRELKLNQKVENGFYLPKLLCGKTLKPEEIYSFIRDGRTKRMDGFTSKAGKVFSASIVRGNSGQYHLDFNQ